MESTCYSLSNDKKATLLSWLNNVTDTNIDTLMDLKDAIEISKISLMIDNSLNYVYDDTEKTWDSILLFLCEQFKKPIKTWINLSKILEGDEFEIAKVVLLLLCAGIENKEARATFIESSTKLDNHYQVQVCHLLTAVLKNENFDVNFSNVLRDDSPFSTSLPIVDDIISSPDRKKNFSNSKISDKLNKTFSPHQRKFCYKVSLNQTPNSCEIFSDSYSSTSPVNALMNSPQVINRLELSEREQEIRKIKRQLIESNNRIDDLEIDIVTLHEELRKKENTIDELKNENYRLNKDIQETERNLEENQIQHNDSVQTQIFKNRESECKFEQSLKHVDRLKNENNSLLEENYELKKQLKTLRDKIAEKSKILSDLPKNVINLSLHEETIYKLQIQLEDQRSEMVSQIELQKKTIDCQKEQINELRNKMDSSDFFYSSQRRQNEESGENLGQVFTERLLNDHIDELEDRINLREVQLNDLKTEYEKRIFELTEKFDLKTKSIESLKTELENKSLLLLELQVNFDKQTQSIEELKSSNLIQSTTLLENKEKFEEFQTNIDILKNELRLKNENQIIIDKEIAELLASNSQKSLEIENLNLNITNLSLDLNKLIKLKNELTLVNDETNNKLTTIIQEYETYRKTNENELMVVKEENKTVEIAFNVCKSNYIELEMKNTHLQNEISATMIKFEELQRCIDHRNEEYECLCNDLKSKNVENEKWKEKAQIASEELKTISSNLTREIELKLKLQSELDIVKLSEKKIEEQLALSCEKSTILKNDLDLCKNEILNFKSEIDLIKCCTEKSDEEIQNLRHQFNSEVLKNNYLEEELEAIKLLKKDLDSQVKLFDKRCQNVTTKLDCERKEKEKYYSDIETLNKQLSDVQQNLSLKINENVQTKKHIELLNADLVRLNSLVIEKDENIYNLHEQLDLNDNELTELIRTVTEKDLYIDNLKNSLTDISVKNSNIEDLRLKLNADIESLYSKITSRDGRIKELEEECDNLLNKFGVNSDEKSCLEKKLKELKTESLSFKEKYEISLNEVDALKSDADKSRENNHRQINEFVARLELTTKEKTDMLDSLNESKLKVKQLVNELETSEKTVNKYKDLSNTYKCEADHVRQEKIKLQVKMETYKETINQLTEENRVAECKIKKSESELYEVKDEVLSLRNEMISKAEIISNLHAEIVDRENSIQELETQISDANAEISYKNRAGLSSEIDSLNKKRRDESIDYERKIGQIESSRNALRIELDSSRSVIKNLEQNNDLFKKMKDAEEKEKLAILKRFETLNEWKREHSVKYQREIEKLASENRILKDTANTLKHKQEDEFKLIEHLKLQLKEEKEISSTLQDKLRAAQLENNLSDIPTVLANNATFEIEKTISSSPCEDQTSSTKGLGTLFNSEDEPEQLQFGVLDEEQLDKNRELLMNDYKGRLSELERRNSQCLPHLRTSYPVETQLESSGAFFNNDVSDPKRKNSISKSTSFVIPVAPSQIKKKKSKSPKNRVLSTSRLMNSPVRKPLAKKSGITTPEQSRIKENVKENVKFEIQLTPKKKRQRPSGSTPQTPKVEKKALRSFNFTRK